MMKKYVYYKGLRLEVDVPKSTDQYIKDIVATLNNMIEHASKETLQYALARLRTEAVIRTINGQIDRTNALYELAETLDKIIYQ